MLPEHYSFPAFLGKRLHLGVTGSIAAYKALDLLRGFAGAQCRVSVCLTKSALRFTPGLNYSALGADSVSCEMFSDDPGHSPFAHLEPSSQADAMLIAPATANCLAKLAHGLADDLLSCQALAFHKPLVIAPAMNPNMWSAAATRENWDTLKSRGVIPVEPDTGLVACGDQGQGKLARLSEIFATSFRALSPQDLAGVKVLVSLGPTREHWDPVRFWSNPSTGRMGASLAVAAWLRGADVHVVSGPVDLELPMGIVWTKVRTALEMHGACLDLWPAMDVGCMTAAVADFRPSPYGTDKYKKASAGSGLSIDFEPNPDILAALGSSKRDNQRLLGFAAETADPLPEMQRKLTVKNLDLIVGNRIDVQGSGFGASTNAVTVLDGSGRLEEWPQLSKTEVAWRLWDLLAHL